MKQRFPRQAYGARLHALSGDGTRFIACNGKVSPALMDVATCRKIRQLVHPDEVTALAFSPDGDLLATGSDCQIRLWNGRTGMHVRTLRGHTGGILALVFAEFSSRLFSGGRDHTVRVWSTQEPYNELQCFKGHKKQIDFLDLKDTCGAITLVSGSRFGGEFIRWQL